MRSKLSAEKTTPTPGDVLAGKYRIERILGRGGMGIVAAAWDTALERTVALKVLRPEGADDESLQRFTRESRAISQLRSEHIVRMYDAGVLDDGTPFLVMEHLVGEDLDAIVAARALPVEEAVMYVLQACEGLAEAHAHGVVHRDLKPPNLFVTTRPDGRPLLKIVDFGIAKQVARASVVDLTAPLVAVGSVLYMSPEQARALPTIAPTSDIFSLGVCLYEVLTRRLPFAGETSFDILANVIKESPVSPDVLVPTLPRELSAVVMRCLEKDPAARYQDVASLAEDLEPFAGALAEGAAVRARMILGGATSIPTPPSARAPLALVTRRDTEVDVPAPTSRREVATREAPAGGAPAASRAPRRRLVAAILAMASLSAIAGVLVAARTTKERDARSGGAAEGASGGTGSRATGGPVASSQPRPEASAEAPSPDATRSAPAAAPAEWASRSPLVPLPREASATARPPVTASASTLGPTPLRSPLAIVTAPPAASPTGTTAASPTGTTAPAAPRFILAAAHVQIGTATNVLGSSPSAVGRTVGPLAGKLTSCFRESLPGMTGVLEGTGTLHLATDEEGLIVSARLDGPVAAPARCIAAAAMGRKVPNVDTGRASADVPLVFVAR